MKWFKRWKERNPWGYVVLSGTMSSLGPSKDATVIGHNSPRREEVSIYRSKRGIGNASHESKGK